MSVLRALYQTDAAYRGALDLARAAGRLPGYVLEEIWGTDLGDGAAAPPVTHAPPARCAHLGTEPVGLRDCPSCRGRVRKKEFACALGLGVAGRAVPSQDCGLHCPGYTPATDATSSA
jgi:hypothetical protein